MANASTHYGNDPMGAPTRHRGALENCPAPECQDRVIESMDDDYVTQSAAEYLNLDPATAARQAADKGLWLECPRGCGYRGARESINNHVNRHHRDK